MTEHPPTPGWEDRAAADLIDGDRQAEDAVRHHLDALLDDLPTVDTGLGARRPTRGTTPAHPWRFWPRTRRARTVSR